MSRKIRKSDHGHSDSSFRPHVEVAAILEEKRLTHKIKLTERTDQTERVLDGLRYLASQPNRHCCVPGCGKPPAYYVGKAFYCFTHRDQAIAHRKSACNYYFEKKGH